QTAPGGLILERFEGIKRLRRGVRFLRLGGCVYDFVYRSCVLLVSRSRDSGHVTVPARSLPPTPGSYIAERYTPTVLSPHASPSCVLREHQPGRGKRRGPFQP